MKDRLLIIILIASAYVISGCKGGSNPTPDDPVVYSFVVTGDCRVDKKDYDAFTNPSTANVAQLERTFSDVAAMKPKPDLFFFAGDLVLGYGDSLAFSWEISAWKKLYEASPLKAAGIEFIPLPGNHETEDWQKISHLASEQVWLTNMAPYIQRGGNGPKADPNGPDSLQTDQSKLTYSFDYKDTHFIVINADPAGRDWFPPAHWISGDVTAAHANPAIKHIFAISHKPAFSWDYDVPGTKNDCLGRYPAVRDIFWNAFEQNHVDAMISTHNHVYRAFSPNHKTWMIVCGNGGTKLEKTLQPKDQYFGFTLIQILKSGMVVEKSYGRNFGASYLDSSSVEKYPTTLRDSNIISWK